MLIEKYVDVRVELPDMKDEYGSPDVYYEEVYVNDNEIKHYIDTYFMNQGIRRFLWYNLLSCSSFYRGIIKCCDY